MTCFVWEELKAVINVLFQGGILEKITKSEYEASGKSSKQEKLTQGEKACGKCYGLPVFTQADHSFFKLFHIGYS